jgi:hypothetical protein
MKHWRVHVGASSNHWVVGSTGNNNSNRYNEKNFTHTMIYYSQDGDRSDIESNYGCSCLVGGIGAGFPSFY